MSEATAFEQYVLELINRARLDPGAEAGRYGIGLNDGLAPGAITATPKQPLAMNSQILAAARAHSDWMLATDTFSHTGVSGSSAADRMVLAGYANGTLSFLWAENIAFVTGQFVSGTAAEMLHEALFRSPGHRTNLLNDTYREAGIGLREGEYRGNTPTAMLTEDFARFGSGIYLLGVTYDDRDGDRFYDPGEGLAGVQVSARHTGSGAVTTVSTGTAGGYQVVLAPGPYEITFQGGGLPNPQTRGVTLTSFNMKVDLDVRLSSQQGQFIGGNGPDIFTGTSRPEVFEGRGGNDQLTGNWGTDIAVFSGVRSQYGVTYAAGAYTVSGPDGIDTLIGIERLRFTDGDHWIEDAAGLSGVVHRFFNTRTGVHFTTAANAEANWIRSTLPQFEHEGLAFRTAADGTSGTVDVFRFFNARTQAHFFTASAAERDWIRSTLPQFQFEGTAYKAYSADRGPQEELYRFFNTQTQAHFFTTSEAERDYVLNTFPQFLYEGIAFWVDPI